MLLMEFDKAGAEWVIVAYICGDARMIGVVESGKSPHVVTGSLMSGASEELVKLENKLVGTMTGQDEVRRLREPIWDQLKDLPLLPRTMSIRQAGKKANHGLNYRETYKMYALQNEIDEVEAKKIVTAYSGTIYPGIKTGFWDMVDEELARSHTLVNCFGRKVRFYAQLDNDLKKAATSFLPQSTNFDMVRRAMVAAYWSDEAAFTPAVLLTQTHDSCTYQYPTSDFILMGEFAIRYAELLSPEIEYNFRKFTVGTELKVGLDWGNMRQIPLVSDAQQMALELRTVWEELRSGAQA